MKSESNKNSNEQTPARVFYVWNYLEWGGAQVYFLGIASRIKDKTKVKFIFPRETSKQFVNFCENLGLEYEFLEHHTDLRPAQTLKRKIERHLSKFKSEFELIKKLSKYDFENSILHIELAPWQSLAALLWLRRRAQIFLTMHNSLPPVSKWRFLLWKMKFAIAANSKKFRIFTSNRDTKNSLAPYVSPEFFETIKVTYTNVNPDEIDEALNAEIDRDALLQKFDLPTDKFLVFCLGQFIDRKGRWTFLEAAKKVLQTAPDTVFVWISNSILTDEESAKIESFELGDSFFLVKSEDVGKDHIELMKFLRLADAYTLPSFVEGLPISLLEAMALEIPSISTNINAIPEAVKNLETGILIEAGDDQALADSILKLKSNVELRRKLAKKGREWVLENFDEIEVARIAYAAYEESLKY